MESKEREREREKEETKEELGGARLRRSGERRPPMWHDKKKVAASFGNSNVHGNPSSRVENVPSSLFSRRSCQIINFILLSYLLRRRAFHPEKETEILTNRVI